MSVKSLYLIVAMLSLTILVGVGVLISIFRGNNLPDQTVGQPKGDQVKHVPKTVDPKDPARGDTPLVDTEPSQGLCCLVDTSLDATASNAENCKPEFAGAACVEWAKLNNLIQEGAHAEDLAHWEYNNTRWATLPRDERPTLKQYNVLLVPSVWTYTYKFSTWVGEGAHRWEATHAACQESRAECERKSGECLVQSPCVETSDVGERVTDGEGIVDTAKHEAKMAEIQAESDTEMRSARWHRCRDRADEEMDDNMKLNCRFNKKTRIYLCDRYFLQHEKDLRQRAYDACDRACPMCQDD